MDVVLKISKQTLWQIVGKIFTSFCTFFILGIIARRYGEDGMGTFTLSLTYLAFFYLLADFGFNVHLLGKFHHLDQRLQSLEFRKLYALRLVWSTLLVALSLTLLPFWPFATPVFNQAVVFGSLAIIFSAVFATTNLIFQSKLRFDLSVISTSVGMALTLILVYLFVNNNQGLPFMSLAHMFGWVAIGTVSLLLAKRYLQTMMPKFDRAFVVDLFKDSWPVAASLALNVVYFRLDSFLLATLKTNIEVGIYNVAYQVFQAVIVLPTFIMNSYYPIMLESLNNNTKKFSAQLKIAAAVLIGLSVSGLVAIWVLAPFIVRILTGGGFNGSSASLQILSYGLPAYFVSSLLMWLMVAKKRYKVMLMIYIVGLIFNFVLNYLYIPQYSFIASSWITVLSEYLILLLQVVVLFAHVQ